MVYHYECPFCGRQTTLTTNNYQEVTGGLITEAESKYGNLNYQFTYVICPNPDCREFALVLSLHERIVGDGLNRYAIRNGKELGKFILRPKGNAKPQPEYIPEELRKDYEEACLILQDSPKASATLSRRCIQGIIRRYYNITKDRLYDEIKALEPMVEPDLWEAIDGIREVGNVGAHSEKDINIIVDVSIEAAKALIELVELLFQETYIKDHHRKSRIKKAVDASKNIKNAKNDVSKNGK